MSIAKGADRLTGTAHVQEREHSSHGRGPKPAAGLTPALAGLTVRYAALAA